MELRTITAKYDGTCRYCGGAIIAGQDKIANREQGWGHAVCPPKNGAKAPTQHKASAASITMGLAAAMASEAKQVRDTDNQAPIVSLDKPFTPSSRQQAIFEAIAWGNGNLVIEAYAGTGKTTTLKHALRWIPANVAYHMGLITRNEKDLNPDDYAHLIDRQGTKVGFCAFNKHIAATLSAVMPAWCWTGTVHSMGYAFLRKHIGNHIQLDANKVDKIMDGISELVVTRDMPNEQKALRRTLRAGLRNLVSLGKAILVDYNNREAVFEMVDNFALDLNDQDDKVIELLPVIMQRCANETDVIDFDDMIWLNLVYHFNNQTYDYLFGDEVQDWNISQRMLVMGAIKPGGRVIAVGDRYQSLYGFRGADVDSIPNLITELNAEVLPLDITYRCPSKHVELAQQIVPGITARPNAPIGSITDLPAEKVAALLQTGDMVLCRVNAPLIPLALRLIRAKIKAVVRGRDIGKGLIELVNRFGTQDLRVLEDRLNEYYDREYNRLLDKEKFAQAAALQDKVDTLFALIAECNEVSGGEDALITRLETIFDDRVNGVVLSSIHRAKGLEAKRVFILRPDLLPHPSAKLPWQQQQEQNIKYVAITRSLDELYFIHGEV